MAVYAGTVTVTASTGTFPVQLTTDSTGFGLASTFASLTAQFASASGSYTGTGYFAAGNDLGSVSASGFTSVLAGDGTDLTYVDSIGGATIVTGSATNYIVAGGNADTIDAGAGSNTIVLTSGIDSSNGATTPFSDTVTTAGFDTISALGVNLNWTNDGASAVLETYSGTLTVSGSGIADIYADNTTITDTGSGSNVFVFNQPSIASGNNVYVDSSLASGNEAFWAGSGNVSLVGGSGNDTFAGGAGSASVTAGGGSNQFLLFGEDATASTSMTVTNATGSDVIGLLDFANGTTYSASITDGNEVVTLSTGASITLLGITNLNTVQILTNFSSES